MSRKKELFLIIDVETANSLEQPLPYDIGYVIADRRGNIVLKRSFVVADIFLNYPEMMESAYYAEKIPSYWDDLKNNKRKLKTIVNIRKQVRSDMKHYNIKKVGGYNINFDRRALNNGIRYCTKSFFRWFFPFETKFFDIWNMACQVILDTNTYCKFALQNGLETDAGNLMTSAEACYKFITHTPTFEEQHTGLEDVEIETAIMAKCYATHKKMDKSINPACWRIPQKRKKNKMPH